jgi:hypothetical protein
VAAGREKYQLWYSIGGINDQFRKIEIEVGAAGVVDFRCYSFLDRSDDLPYIFFVYLPEYTSCDIENMEDFIMRLPSPDLKDNNPEAWGKLLEMPVAPSTPECTVTIDDCYI